MKDFIKVAKAISDPNRVKILKMLQHKIMCVCELKSALRIAQPTVSKHLRILEEAGLVYCQRDEKWVNYYIADGNNNPYAANILGNLKYWLEEDMEIKELIYKLPSIKREDICCQ